METINGRINSTLSILHHRASLRISGTALQVKLTLVGAMFQLHELTQELNFHILKYKRSSDLNMCAVTVNPANTH